MSQPNNVPEILTVGKLRGSCRFTFERLKEISICLSNLDLSIKLPILQALVEQGDLQKRASEYKSILLNCVLDCIRLALPLSTNLFGKIKLKPPRDDASSRCQSDFKQSNAEIVSDIILCGLIENIESLLEALSSNKGGTTGDSITNLSKYMYSLERATEKNSRVLIFLVEGTHESKRQDHVALIFGLLLDLFEVSVAGENAQVLDICKYAISSIISYSGTINVKSELILSFLLKLIKQFKSLDQIRVDNFLSHTSAILSAVGVSGISYITNTILTESLRFLRNEIKPSIDFGGEEGKETQWWREESVFIPDLIRRSMQEKVKDIQTRVIYVIHFLESISEEYVQAVVTQMICDLREQDDKLRFQTVKMVTQFILLGIKMEYNFTFQGYNRTEHQVGEDNESRLKKQLMESWLSRANDKQHDIRMEIIMGVVKATNIFLQRSELGYCEKFIKFIIELRDITCPSLREDLIKAVSAWLTNKRKELNSSELMDESIQYLLRHICDKNRDIRIYLIKYLKDYIEIPELSRSLWLLWYVSFKQNDLQMRSIIEDVLLELNQLETLEMYLPIKGKPESQCNISIADSQSNSTIYKVIKTFNYQRLALLKSFRLFVCSLFLIQFSDADLSKYLESLKLDIAKQIEYFFIEFEDSKGAAEDMLQKIQGSLVSREGFVKWAVLLGLVVWNKESQGETQRCIESVAKNLELDKSQEFNKIIRYLSVFSISSKTVNCKVLSTIFSPSLSDKSKKANQACVETCLDSLDILVLKLQFKYKVNMLNRILNGKESGEEVIQVLNDAVSLYNQHEIFKLYECFYSYSKKLFRRKLLKHLREVNSKFKHASCAFNEPFAENCFACDGGRRNDFITESLPTDESRIMARDIMSQMFPSISSSISNVFCSYSDFQNSLNPAILKSSDKHTDINKTLDLFILRLQAEKKWQDKFTEEASVNAILSKLVLLIEEALLSPSDLEDNQRILVSKLIGAGCLLFFKVNAVEEALFDRFFQVCYDFNILCDAKTGVKSNSSGPPFQHVSLESKLFYAYFVYKVESDFHELAGIANSYSLQEGIFVFNSYFYIEMINFVCFSELENFFRKNHVRIFKLGQRLCKGELGRLMISMISRILTLDKGDNGRAILSTTLGRSLGMSFIPMLCQKLGSELESQELYQQVEKVIESTTGIFVNSAIYANNVKNDQLYCVLDCIVSVFIYYISKLDNFSLEPANHSIHCFVKIIYSLLFKKLKRNGNGFSNQLIDVGVHCIALLGEIGDNYNYAPDDSSNSETKRTRITNICKGTQFHMSYFFVSNEEPEIFMRENTSVFDNWNYLRSTHKFRIPSYLFSRAQSKRDMIDASQFEWSVPVLARSKSTKGKQIKKAHKSKLRKLAASKTRVCRDSNGESLEGKYDGCDSDSFSSLSENSKDENWVGNVQLNAGAPKRVLRSSNLRPH